MTTTFGLRSTITGHDKGRVDAPVAKVSSKGGWNGQWAVALLAGCALTGTLATAGCHRHAQATVQAGARTTPSGLPVPRYVSLKFAKVNARGGPGDDSRLLWVYHAKGLPLQVVAETDDWRRVCDPQGQISWVHKRTIDDKRSVMRTDASDLILRRAPSDMAAASATLVGHALAQLKSCDKGWCKVTAGHATGWAPASALWGTADGFQCRSD